jgi:glycosyltransferase involved in cell wall biosynthesis
MAERVPTPSGTELEIVYGAALDNRLLRGVVGAIYALLHVPRIIRTHSVDTVIVYNLTSISVVLSLLAYFMGKEVYLDYEDSARVSRYRRMGKLKDVYIVFEWLLRHIAKGAVGASRELLSSLRIENTLWLPGILGDDLATLSGSHQKQPWQPGRPIRMIYAGGLDPSKGIDRFLRAIDRIEASVDMVVCGQGVLQNEIEDLCRKSRHKVTFRGLVSRQELIELMVAADVGINPHRSDMHKGGSWPFKVIEYLGTCGTVFCSNTNALPASLASKLFLYEGNEVEEIRTALVDFLSAWPTLAVEAEGRRRWTLQRFSIAAIGERLSDFLSGDARCL